MPRQVDRERRRALSEDAVVAIAAESGFAAVTIRAVAERIEASTSAVTHYVSGREELLRSAVRRELDRTRADVTAAIDGLDDAAAVRVLVETSVLRPEEDAHRFWLALVLGAAGDPVLRAELDRFNAWWDHELRDRLLRLVPGDPDDAGDLIDVVVAGVVLAGFDEGEPWSPDRRTRLLHGLWRLLGL